MLHHGPSPQHMDFFLRFHKVTYESWTHFFLFFLFFWFFLGGEGKLGWNYPRYCKLCHYKCILKLTHKVMSSILHFQTHFAMVAPPLLCFLLPFSASSSPAVLPPPLLCSLLPFTSHLFYCIPHPVSSKSLLTHPFVDSLPMLTPA